MKFRHEYKHPINPVDLLQLRTRLSAVAEYDKYSGADGRYLVKSLYFDNYRDSALREKIDGVNCREKFRIRYYGTDTSFIRLEKKSKVNGLCSKESARITEEECHKIMAGDIDFMLHDDRPLLNELYAKMHYRLLRPRCIVVYWRESFVYPLGNVRVTLDTDIGGSYHTDAFLDPNLVVTKGPCSAVLEVKWDEYLPQIIRDVVQLKSRKTTAFSKYAVARI